MVPSAFGGGLLSPGGPGELQQQQQQQQQHLSSTRLFVVVHKVRGARALSWHLALGAPP